jgi:hypothetical protein
LAIGNIHRLRLVSHRGWREKYSRLLSRAAEKFPELPGSESVGLRATRATRATFWSVRLGKINISLQLAGRERPQRSYRGASAATGRRVSRDGLPESGWRVLLLARRWEAPRKLAGFPGRQMESSRSAICQFPQGRNETFKKPELNGKLPR